MFISLVPGLIVAAITILTLRFVFGFLLRPPGAPGLGTRLIRFAAYLSVRLERFWSDVSRGIFRKENTSQPSYRRRRIRR
jgi:multisubunit Na+/H+ antiporter MnhE subunit